MNASVLLMIASLFYLIFISILYFSKKKVNTFETKIYKYILISSIFGVIMDMIGVYVSINIDDSNIIRWIVLKLYYSYLLTIMYLLSSYMFISGNKKNLDDKEKKQFKILTVIFLIVFVVNLILPVHYYKDGDIIYAYGIGTNFLYIMSGILILSWIIYLIKDKNINKLKNKKYTPMIIFIILVVPIVLIQMFNPQLLLVSGLLSFIVVIMYHTIENPDIKMIEQLNVAKTTAEKANMAKSDFLSSMSHEIRTPLNAIVGFAECIKQSDDLEEMKDNANDVVTASNTLLEIVNGILDISKIESGKLELVETDYDTRKLFREVERLIISRIGDKELDFKIDIACDIPKVLYGDALNIKKILINLLTNAVKYTDKGYVLLNVKCVNSNDICRLIISVKDSGRGIKQEQIDKLFTKFDRLDEDRNTTIEGTGLGLAITKQLVDMMNGKIVVNSIYGEGSDFTVAIDQKISVKEIEIEEQEELLNLDLTGKKILIVDDNKLNLKVAQKLLASYNPIVDVCESGFECLDKINLGNQYDLILMDDMMPKMRGKEALNKLKQIPNFNTPVVVLTANAISGIKEQYLSHGFSDYLSKPIDKQDLYNILKKIVYQNPKEIKEDKEIIYKNYSDKMVLMVDDNKLNIKVAEHVMKPYNFTIEEVYSGYDCIEKVKNIKYDLIFMDIMMPGMDGIETLNKIKEIPNFNTPVVALTADSVFGARDKFLNAGFDEYIAKPINPLLLNQVIDKLFENKAIKNDEINNVSNTKGSIDYLRQNKIDIDKSVELLGSIENYAETLKYFLASINDRVRKMQNFIMNNDMENYAILIHSLKSDSQYLGFTTLAELSYKHELKSKENDISFIKTHYNELIIELSNVINIVKKYI